MIERWIWSDLRQELVTPEEYYAEKHPVARSNLPRPYVISDTMDPIINHANGQRYDSKSQYYAAVRQAGCEIVGNDSSFKNPKPREYDAPGLKEDIVRAVKKSIG